MVDGSFAFTRWYRGDGALAIAHGTGRDAIHCVRHEWATGGTSSCSSVAPMPLSVATSATLPRDARRRGAPLLRPLARLTAFGGYVATVRKSAYSVATSAPLPCDARRRGAPLLRPLARLTAFGGYVATVRKSAYSVATSAPLPRDARRRVSPLPECLFASTWTCGGDLLYYMT